jgi:PEP-CTERM motif
MNLIRVNGSIEMNLSKLSILIAVAGAFFATSASASVYFVTFAAGTEIISGDLTVVGTTATAFTGTATGFGTPNPVFDGPVVLGQSSGGPTFPGDNKWNSSGPYYVSGGNSLTGGGLQLTTNNAGTNYNFLIFDYVDTFNNYGDRIAWFGSSGGDNATITVAPVPEPSTWAMMLLGFAALGFLGYRRRKVAVA